MATNEIVKTRYYRIIINRKGERVLQTHKKILADCLSFTTERKVFIFNNEDGTKTYSIECDEQTQMIAEMLCLWHSQALRRNLEEQQGQSNK